MEKGNKMPALKREKIMMCCPFTRERFEKWGMSLVQPKLNGERCRVIWDADGNVSLKSSYNKDIPSVPHIVKQLSEVGLKNTELDGELYRHGMDLRRIQSIVSRKVNLHPDFEQIHLHLFDLIDDRDQFIRWTDLNHLYRRALVLLEHVHIVETTKVNSLPEFEKTLAQYIELGYEGVVLRKVNGIYQRDLHSTQIMKIKPRSEDIYTVVGVEEEVSIHGDPKNALGAFVCSVNGEETFKVGTGNVLTRAGREWWWKNSPIGKRLRIKYQELTPNGIPYCPVAMEII